MNRRTIFWVFSIVFGIDIIMILALLRKLAHLSIPYLWVFSPIWICVLIYLITFRPKMRKCRICRGTGSLGYYQHCPACEGQGRVPTE